MLVKFDFYHKDTSERGRQESEAKCNKRASSETFQESRGKRKVSEE